MRILLVHNFYGSAAPSGENQVFDAERALLVAHGNEVETFVRYSDEIREQGLWGVAKGAFSTPWNPWAARAVGQLVEKFRPDVVHVHNTFPLISPAVFHAVGPRAGRVLTLHNYRVFCAAAIPMRQGKVCVDCLNAHSSWPALRHGCYRGSQLATVPLAVGIGLHHVLGTWNQQVDAFIALTEFQKTLMIESGLPGDRVHVKPNFYPGSPQVIPWREREPYAIFAGRLTEEKGVQTLIRAWRAWGPTAPELRVVGEGVLRRDLEGMAAGLPVRFLGQLSPAEAQAQIAGAYLLILPSECFEGFPMVVREAFAFGTPAAVSDIGPLPGIVKDGVNGIVFPPSTPKLLAEKVRVAWRTPGMLEGLATEARAAYTAKYAEDPNYDALMAIYKRAIVVSGGGAKAWSLFRPKRS